MLDRARVGDEQAFRELTGPYVRELHLHCYRMLGSLVDADDLLQETLIAAWRGLDGFAGRSSLRAWLYRVATNRCLNAIRDAKRRAPAQPVAPFVPPDPSRRGEVTWLQPYPDVWLEELGEAAPGPAATYEARAGVELAFIAALQRLPPRQTAVVILADVLGFSAAEVAGMVGSSATAVKGMLQRGRAGLARHRATAGHHPVGGPGSAAERDLAHRFAAAFTAGDVDGVIALLTDDAWLAMPPAPHEYVGSAAIAGFLRTSTGWRGRRRLELVPTRANGQPAFGCYLGRPGEAATRATGVLVLTMSGDRIGTVTRFLDDDLHRRFGLADEVLAGQDP
jgi:RNA polymerase sigma-70 factor (ECF subfamily)